jgi:hypothetical protein
VSLPSRAPRLERRRAVRAWLEEFHHAHADDELAWIALPPLIVRLGHRSGRFRPRRLRPQRTEPLRRYRPARRTSGWRLAGGHLFLALTENQARAQEPIGARFESRNVPQPADPPAARWDDLGRRAVAVADRLMGLARRRSLELPAKPRLVYRHMITSARALAACEAMLAAASPRTVVIGSTHAILPRALALAARRAGIPSIYVPHAPVIADATLVDLPVDVAALRGPAEIQLYDDLGADREGMEAIGNPAVDLPDEPPELRRDDRVALALPTDDEWVLRHVIGMVHEALGAAVVASPHPRADRDALRGSLPSEWQIWEGRTLDLLRHGPPALVQFSSGAGLEGLQLGVPTIDLRFPGERPNYPFLEDERILRAESVAELRDAVAAARRIPDQERGNLVALAARWTCAAGDVAARAGAELLERAALEGTRANPVWDAWRPPRRLQRLLSRVRRGVGASDR